MIGQATMLVSDPDGGKMAQTISHSLFRVQSAAPARQCAMARPRSLLCVGCWQQLKLPVPLHGIASAPFRVVGIKPSRMNPNTCTICELAFTKIMRARNVTIDATVFFADLRGYTTLTQTLPPETMAALLDAFYDACGNAIWDHDGLLNKT